MKTCFRKLSTLTLCLLILAALAPASQKDKGRGADSPVKGKDSNTYVGVQVFVKKDRQLIRQHYLTKQGSLPPGLAKRQGDLPPGLEKQLRRYGHLPPGLEKRLDPFPLELEQRLRPLKAGLTRGVIGVHAVIIDQSTSLILDVFKIR